jgi:hypothetical protein
MQRAGSDLPKPELKGISLKPSAGLFGFGLKLP